MSLRNIIKLSKTVWELWPAQDFGFRGDKYITKKVHVCFLSYTLHAYCALSMSTKYYQNISNHFEVMECTRIRPRNSFRDVN